MISLNGNNVDKSSRGVIDSKQFYRSAFCFIDVKAYRIKFLIANTKYNI